MTATAAPPSQAPAEDPGFQMTQIGDLFESPLNPRKYFDKDDLADLTASIQAHGILAPILARYSGQGYEIAAGARRFRAASKAGLERVPVILRHMTDTELLEILTIENLQRVDVTPLEEAGGYRALMEKAGYDVPRIAGRISKSEKYVYDRLKLLELGAEAKKALEKEEITPSHAILLARVDPVQQKEVLASVKQHTDRGEKPSVRDLNYQIEESVRVRKREDEVTDMMAKAVAEHPDEKKIWQLSEYSSGEGDTLGYGQWREAKKDTEGRLVGVVVPARHAMSHPKIVYFTKVKEREQPHSGSLSRIPTPAETRERNSKRREQKEREAVGGLAVRRAVMEVVKPDLPFFLAVADALLDGHGSWHAGIAQGLGELVGIPNLGAGYTYQAGEKVKAKLGNLSLQQLIKLVAFIIVEPDNKFDRRGERRTALLCKSLKLDPDTIITTARTQAALARKEAKAQAQTSAGAKARKGVKKRTAKGLRTRAKARKGARA